jgi:inner membrane protein
VDNLTHSLFALTLARTGLGRAGRGTTVALLVASNAPDVDFLATGGGGLNYLAWHRGPTHGPLGVIGLGLLSACLVAGGQRLNPRWRDEQADAPLAMLVAVSMIGALLHILMDLPTVYGTRLLSPFDWHWFAVDWLPIVDIYLLIILVAGLFFGRASPEARRRNAAIVLALMAANYGVRAAAHHEALVLAPRLFGPTLPPPCQSTVAQPSVLDSWPRGVPGTAPAGRRCLVEIAAMPTFLSPFAWRIVARMSNAYELHDIDLMDERFRRPASESDVFWRQTIRYPDAWTPAVEQAATTRIGRVFLGFSRFAAARSATDAGGLTTVRFTDMRFVSGPFAPFAMDQTRSANLFSVTVRIGADGRILSERLGR